MGFVAVLAILSLLIGVGAGWYVWSQSRPAPSNHNQEQPIPFTTIDPIGIAAALVVIILPSLCCLFFALSPIGGLP